MIRLFSSLFIGFCCCLSAKVQIIPIQPAPQPEHVRTYIVYPKKGQMYSSDEVWIQVKMSDFTLEE